jgi:hypothetical protein
MNHLKDAGGIGLPNLTYQPQSPGQNLRLYTRQTFSLLSTTTLFFLWAICGILWAVRYVPHLNKIPLPPGASFVGPLAAAGVTLAYVNWLRTVLSRLAVAWPVPGPG